MKTTGWMLHVLLLAIAISLGALALRPYVHPERTALAFTGGYDYVDLVSPLFLYKGQQGVLLWDKRNGNVWFIGRGDDLDLSFTDPVFIAQLPLDKLNQTPQ